jgi:DNA topoisomerase-2
MLRAKTNSYVNGVQTFNGGSHIDYVYEQLISVIRPEITKKHDIDVTPAQIRNHLQLVLFMKDFNNPKFDSQTKERLTNSRAEIKEYFDKIGFNWTSFAKKILSNEAIIGPVIDALLAKKLMADKRALAAEAKKNSKREPEKHLKAKDFSDKSKTQLFIVEGHSAIGSLIDVREPYQGGYALKGKILNIDEMSALDIMKNNEIADIISIIGLKFDEVATKDNTDYYEINLFTDADQDGSHIVSLLINFFAKYWPELFIDGRVNIIKSPLVKCSKGKDVKYYNTLEMFMKDSNSGVLDGYSFAYKKGLGSLSEQEYKNTIMDRNNYFTVKLDEKYKSTLNMAFGPSPALRREFLLGHEDINEQDEE